MGISKPFVSILVISSLILEYLSQGSAKAIGCPADKNACVYPIDDTNLQFLVRFDFQVTVHVDNQTKLAGDWASLIKVTINLPNGLSRTPEQLWNRSAETRTWVSETTDESDESIVNGVDFYAIVYRNVRFRPEHGFGKAVVTVSFMDVTTVVSYTIRQVSKRRARNVILLVGDGMSLPMISAARLVSRGMQGGKYKDKMNVHKMPYFGMQNPSSLESIIPDGASSATAINTGHKTSSNAINVYDDGSDDPNEQPKMETLAEHIKIRFNMSVGVVTTAEIQDASASAVWAHTRQSSEKAGITAQAVERCDDCKRVVMPDVLMGGGGRYFLPGYSVDGRDWYQVYEENGYTVTHSRQQMFDAVNDSNTDKLLTISHIGDMEVWLDRNVYRENTNFTINSPTGNFEPPVDQPNLDEMVMSAIEILSRNENGFYLMVGASGIDRSAHALDTPRTLSDVIELDNTVGKVLEWAKANGDETLIVVTSNHAHGFDVFGTVDTELWDMVKGTQLNPVSDVEHLCSSVTDNGGTVYKRYIDFQTGSPVREATLTRRMGVKVYDEAGFADFADEDGDNFPDSWDVRRVLAAGMNNFPDHTEDYRVSPVMKRPSTFSDEAFTYVNNPVDDPNGIFLAGNLGRFGGTGVHTLQDVGVFGYGPGSERIGNMNMDNTELFHIIANALGFGSNGVIPNPDSQPLIATTVVKCVNTDQFCHCDSIRWDSNIRCSCKRYGPTVYVLPNTKLCKKVDGKPVEDTD